MKGKQNELNWLFQIGMKGQRTNINWIFQIGMEGQQNGGYEVGKDEVDELPQKPQG